jgi:cytochrome c-type biogenesis protein CcmE
MDPARKRKIRLIVALTAAVVLAGALVWTSFGNATEATTPSRALHAAPGQSIEVTGKVVPGSIRRGETLRFRVRDRDGTASIPVVYRGAVPDPFRDGREVIVTGTVRDGTFVAKRDSLVTKCPSKFKNQPGGKTL